MKAFKKLMAAALVCVMALTMLTGCALSEKLDRTALVKALNDVNDVYKYNNDLNDEAAGAWKQKNNNGIVTEKSGTVTLSGTVYNYAIEEVPSSATSKGNWKDQAGRINTALKDSKKTDSKIKVGVEFVTGKKGTNDCDYVVVIAQAK